MRWRWVRKVERNESILREMLIANPNLALAAIYVYEINGFLFRYFNTNTPGMLIPQCNQ